MYVPQLTFTRFIAAILIVFFHYAQDLYPFTITVIHNFLASCNISVSFFFILSGFVMIISNANKEKIVVADFYWKRFKRIYPIYAVSMLMVLIFIILSRGEFDFSGFVLNVFLIQAWIPTKAVSFNYIAWSISVEIFFYLLFPFVFNYLFKKMGLVQLAILIIGFWIVSQMGIHYLRYSDFFDGPRTPSHRFILFFPLLHLASFLVGNLVGQLFLNNPQKGNYFFVIIACMTLVVLSMLLPMGYLLQNGILCVFFGPMIYFIAKDQSFLTKWFSLKPFVFLGEISYAIYILQNPVFVWMRKISQVCHIDNPQVFFYLSLAVLLIASAVVYVLVERIIYSKKVSFNWS